MSNPVDYTQYDAQPHAQPPKNRGWVKWVACGCVLAVLLLAGFIAAIFFTVQKATAGPEESVQGFIAAARAGDYRTAHDYFSVPLKEVQPYEDFVAAAEQNSSFFKITETSFTNRSVDMNGAELSGNVTLESGTTVPAQFELVRENDQWKLISYNIGS